MKYGHTSEYVNMGGIKKTGKLGRVTIPIVALLILLRSISDLSTHFERMSTRARCFAQPMCEHSES